MENDRSNEGGREGQQLSFVFFLCQLHVAAFSGQHLAKSIGAWLGRRKSYKTAKNEAVLGNRICLGNTFALLKSFYLCGTTSRVRQKQAAQQVRRQAPVIFNPFCAATALTFCGSIQSAVEFVSRDSHAMVLVPSLLACRRCTDTTGGMATRLGSGSSSAAQCCTAAATASLQKLLDRCTSHLLSRQMKWQMR